MNIENVWPGWKVKEGKPLGEGASGTVYEIYRDEFGHRYQAACKVIEVPGKQSEVRSVQSDGLTNEEVTVYFRNMVKDIVKEIQWMSEMKGNTNIVSYEDHRVIEKEDEFGWKIYIRMELLNPLFDYVKEHPLTVRDVVKLGMDICNALRTCQKRNIIHRDIKPENIFITRDGDFKLGDFGIARQLEKTSYNLSKKGTMSYMAPEVYKCLPYNSTVDIYSLGIVMYRYLNNNRTPFLPQPPQSIYAEDKERANTLRFSGQALPLPCNAEGRLAEIVMKACAYEPKERYDSAQDMYSALQEIQYTKQERHLIYPEGDMLQNERYVTEKTGDGRTPYRNENAPIEEDYRGQEKTYGGASAKSEDRAVKRYQMNWMTDEPGHDSKAVDWGNDKNPKILENEETVGMFRGAVSADMEEKDEIKATKEREEKKKVNGWSQNIKKQRQGVLHWNYKEQEDGTIEIIGLDGEAEELSIPFAIDQKSVTKIKKQALSKKEITDVKILCNISELEDGVFQGCEKLVEIIIPGSIEEIGNQTFGDCKRLEKINLPENLTKIGNGAFRWCESIKKLVLPESVEEIGEYAFGSCKGLENLQIPKRVRTIGAGTFQFCEGLERILFSGVIKSLENNVFEGCCNLKFINLPDGMIYIGENTFAYCTSLARIKLPESLEKIEDNAFGEYSGIRRLETVLLVKKKSYAHQFAKKNKFKMEFYE